MRETQFFFPRPSRSLAWAKPKQCKARERMRETQFFFPRPSRSRPGHPRRDAMNRVSTWRTSPAAESRFIPSAPLFFNTENRFFFARLRSCSQIRENQKGLMFRHIRQILCRRDARKWFFRHYMARFDPIFPPKSGLGSKFPSLGLANPWDGNGFPWDVSAKGPHGRAEISLKGGRRWASVLTVCHIAHRASQRCRRPRRGRKKGCHVSQRSTPSRNLYRDEKTFSSVRPAARPAVALAFLLANVGNRERECKFFRQKHGFHRRMSLIFPSSRLTRRCL